MDLFGAIVLGCATAVGGGMMRDIVLGKFPPVLFTDPIYTEFSFITCILGFLIEKRHLHTTGEELTILLYMADSIGLGIFVVVGSQSAFHAGYGHNLLLSVRSPALAAAFCATCSLQSFPSLCEKESTE